MSICEDVEQIALRYNNYKEALADFAQIVTIESVEALNESHSIVMKNLAEDFPVETMGDILTYIFYLGYLYHEFLQSAYKEIGE